VNELCLIHEEVDSGLEVEHVFLALPANWVRPQWAPRRHKWMKTALCFGIIWWNTAGNLDTELCYAYCRAKELREVEGCARGISLPLSL